MPIDSIITQPAFQSRLPAYAPVYFRVKATATNGAAVPPVVFCDIYLNGIYYKSLAKTQPVSVALDGSEWEFDIQDAAQERTAYSLPPISGAALMPALANYAGVFCRFRSSGINSQGFTVAEGTEPIQETGLVAPVAGTGFESNAFFVVEASIQHDEAQNFPVLLNEYKTGGSWNAAPPIFYPLTHRPARYYMRYTDSDYFTVLAPNDGILIANITIFYLPKGQTEWLTLLKPFAPGTQGTVEHLPNGPANIATIFPELTFKNIEEYFLIYSSNTTQLLSTPVNVLTHPCEDEDRLHFINRLGGIDGITLKKMVVSHETKSGSYQRPFQYPFVRAEHATAKFNNRANDPVTAVNNDYLEQDQLWLSELFDAPAAWITLEVFGQGLDYLPVVVSDGKADLLKQEDRFSYQAEITYTPSHEKVLLRN